MRRIREELRQQGVTTGFLWLLGGVLLALILLLLWMALAARAELIRNGVPRDMLIWQVGSTKINSARIIPYDPTRTPSSRGPDGVADMKHGDKTVRMRFQWVEKPSLRLVGPEHAKGRDRNQAGSDGQSGADGLATEGAGKAEPYQSEGYDPHCKSPQGKDNSDLCAQWIAAREMSSANAIGRSGLALQWLNLVVTLIVGAMTAIGLLVAAQATRLAAQAMDAASRVVRGQVIPVIKATGTGSSRRLQGRLENVGESPAEIVGHKWAGALSVAAAEALVDGLSVDRASVFVAAGEKDFALTLGDSPAFATVVEYDDIIEGRWRRWAVFERMSDGKYLRRRHGEKRRA